MMIWLTDAVLNTSVAVNKEHVVAVFTVADESEHKGKTAVALINGQILVKEKDLDIVNQLNG